MSKELYEFLKDKGYSDSDIELTDICLSCGIKLPNEVLEDYYLYLRSKYK